VSSVQQSEDFLAEVEFRRHVADVLGDAASRKAARERLGLTLRQVAAEVGLSVAAICWRESDKWMLQRGSVESEAGWRYCQFIAAAKGKAL
jgi:AcrR family transcriptional regulator